MTSTHSRGQTHAPAHAVAADPPLLSLCIIGNLPHSSDRARSPPTGTTDYSSDPSDAVLAVKRLLVGKPSKRKT